MNETISPSELHRQLGDSSVKLIDVMPPADYDACHITGAENACVYEVGCTWRTM